MKIIPREVRRKKPITWSRKIRELQKRLKMGSLQREVLIGTLLGDGCLVANAYGKNYRLQIEHEKRQKRYVEWKYHIFHGWCVSKPKFRQKTKSWRFRTISHPIFRGFQKMFYRNRKKVLPKGINKLLRNPISLAVWFMDDGGKMTDRAREYGYLMNVQQFPLRTVKHIQEVLQKNFSLFSTRQWNNSGYRLYFGKKSRKKFDDIIRKYINPCLKYKLLLTP